MKLKPIQDIASSPAQPKAPDQPTQTPSEPEIVSDIPVRAPVAQPDINDEVPKTPDHGPDLVPSDSSKEEDKPKVALEPTAQKDQEKPKTKDSKPKPIFTIVIASVAIISLAVGAYLKFLANS
ncbi:MAG TPA: hypothetical protein VJJ78_01145 [Candidatus Saccharimonadales bacterium]|nr:hypothetical protein [Candidatus Saccharimonadales bacterium]